GSPGYCFHEFWKIQQRQSNLIAHLFSYHRIYHAVDVIQPFINCEFIDFFLGLPFDQRFNRSLFKQVARDLFPQAFSLPSNHFNKDSIIAKVESLCERAESYANKINTRQEAVLSPFKYEQHEKNLQNYLSDHVIGGS